MKDLSSYQCIPDRPINQPRHPKTLSDRINLLAASIAKSKYCKPILIFTIISTFFLVFTRPCITCHFVPYDGRKFQNSKKINLKPYHSTHLVSSSIKSSHYNSAPDYSFPGRFLQRHPSEAHHVKFYQPEDYSIEEFLPIQGCVGNVKCHARLIVTKEGKHVSINAGFNILPTGYPLVPVDVATKERAYSVTPTEAFQWSYTLFYRLRSLLTELNCKVDMDDVAKAFFFTSKDAASCPYTNHPKCLSLTTIRECELPIIQDDCQVAFEKCEFTFLGENGLATFNIHGKPDKPFTPLIVSKDPSVTLGVLNSNNIIPQFIEDDGVYPITDFGSQKFASTQFKPYYISEVKGSGIGHQTFHADQEELASNRCIRIYFTHIQLLYPTSNLNDVPESENKCVVFRTQ